MRIGGQWNLMTVQRRVQIGTTAANEPNFVWQNWRPDIFCEVTVKRGKEQFDPVGKKRYSEDVWQFRTRYDEVRGLDATMKIVHEGNTYDIKAILPDGQKQWDCVIEAVLQDGALGGKALIVAITDFIELGIVGEAFPALQINASGGTSPYSFTAESGMMVPGLSINAGTGSITGTPTNAGTFPVSIEVVDAAGARETLPTFDITVEEADP
ncbi:phage head completion protein [Rhizobium azibense]|uniref:Putative Ig domain-containing protein n=1 Tax=Rhizobium azibense TaxID=1136135 RepID=A0A4R3RKJ9_9HYPH|nr:putative Ig domain-containing protein [Rhizobium azibense]TCU34162.1 putative Ig domain-containing protein [Rhizobium azibense]